MSEEKYFTAYQRRRRAGLNAVAARVLAEQESGTNPKKSIIAKLKGKVQKELEKTRTEQVTDQLKRSGLTDEQIKRLKGN